MAAPCAASFPRRSLFFTVPCRQPDDMEERVWAHPLNGKASFLKLRNLPMRRYRIAVIPGDGIGKEVIPAGLEVLKAVAEREGGIEWTFDQFDWGSDYYRS